MEMCFKFLNGSRTIIFLESMRFHMIAEKKIQVQASASQQQRAQPEFTASLSHTCSSPRGLRQDSLDLLPCLSRNTYAWPGIQDDWLLSNGCRAGLPSACLWTKLCGADMFATKQTRSRFTAAGESQEKLCSQTPILLQKGAMGFFLLSGKAQSIFLQKERT